MNIAVGEVPALQPEKSGKFLLVKRDFALDPGVATAFLRRLHRLGKLFFGTSAGSIMLSRKWVRWRDPHDDRSTGLFPCLGFTPILCDTHSEDDDRGELKALLALSPTGAIAYGIVTGTAIVVEPNGTISALGEEVDRFRRGAGGVEQIESLAPNKDAQ